MTETWRREAGAWKLSLVHVYAMLKDSPAIELPSASMTEDAGRYSSSNDLVYVIEWDGKQLTGARQGRKPTSLSVEVRDVLFVPGQPRVREIFQRDKEGKITGFVDRGGRRSRLAPGREIHRLASKERMRIWSTASEAKTILKSKRIGLTPRLK